MMFPVVLLLAAAQATAPVEGPSDLSTKETRQVMHDYGACLVAKRPAQAAAAILADVDNGVILKRYPALIDGACLGRQVLGTVKMRFAGDYYRYALADALVAREFSTAPVPVLDGVTRLSHREAGNPPTPVAPTAGKAAKRRYEEALKHHNESVVFRFLAIYGECVVRADPAGAKLLLVAKPGTPAEGQAFTALGEPFGLCMPEGQTVEMGKTALRGSIAVNYYRLARAAAGK